MSDPTTFGCVMSREKAESIARRVKWLESVWLGDALTPTGPRGPVEAAKADAINPDHYRGHPSGVECIQIAEHFGFCLGNVVKYCWRAGLKEGSDDLEDLRKAAWYLAREIERRERMAEKRRQGEE